MSAEQAATAVSGGGLVPEGPVSRDGGMLRFVLTEGPYDVPDTYDR